MISKVHGSMAGNSWLCAPTRCVMCSKSIAWQLEKKLGVIMRNLSSHLPEFPKVSEIVGVAGCKRPFPRSGIRLPILESHPLGVCHFAEKLFWDAQPATQAPFEMLRVWWEGLFGPTLRAVATWAQSPKNKLEWAGWTEDKKNFLLCIHLYVSTNHWVVSYSRKPTFAGTFARVGGLYSDLLSLTDGFFGHPWAICSKPIPLVLLNGKPNRPSPTLPDRWYKPSQVIP